MSFTFGLWTSARIKGWLSQIPLAYAAAVVALYLAMAVTPQTVMAATAAPASRLSTQRDLRDAQTAFMREVLLKDFETSGSKDARWNDAARTFLEHTCTVFGSTDIDDFYIEDAVVSKADLLEEGKRVLALGCDDPCVEYSVAALTDTLDRGNARPLLERAWKGIEKHPVSAFRKAMIALRLGQQAGDRDVASDLRKQFRAAMVETSRVPVPTQFRRCFETFVWSHFSSRQEQQTFVAALEADGHVDPYVLDLARGLLEVELAWDSRGGGFASTVSSDGWKGFAEHLAKASEALNRAWRLDPSLPGAPLKMLPVALGAGEDVARGDTVTWFGRVLDAQFDNTDAYAQYLGNILLPRWQGDYDSILQLADICRKDPRQDTLVPWMCVSGIDAVSRDSGKDMLERDDIYNGVIELADQMRSHTRNEDKRTIYQLAKVAAAWDTGRKGDARKWLDPISDAQKKKNARQLYSFGAGKSPHSISQVYALTGNHRQLFEALDQAVHKQLVAAARPTAAELERLVSPGDDEWDYFRHLKGWVDAKTSYDRGDWAPMQWDDDNDFWEFSEGNFVFSEGAMTGFNTYVTRVEADYSRTPKTIYWKGWPVDPDVEVEVTVRPLVGRGDRPLRMGGVALMQQKSGHRGWIGVQEAPDSGGLFMEGGRVSEGRGLEGTAVLRVQLAGGKCRLFLNDADYIGHEFEVPAPYVNFSKIGFGSIESSQIEFSHMRIRKVSDTAISASRPKPPATDGSSLATLELMKRHPEYIAAAVCGIALLIALAIGVKKWLSRRTS